MPPEMFLRQEYDSSADGEGFYFTMTDFLVWSFSMVLYVMMTLIPPYEEIATKDLASHIAASSLILFFL
jgi:hypothetical protein